MASKTMVATEETPIWSDVASGEEMERRIQRLEDAVAALVDTQLAEDRIAAKVLETLEHRAESKPSGTREPLVKPVEPAPLAMASQAPEEPSSYQLRAAQALIHVAANSPDALSLFGEIWWEVRTGWRMVRDPYYKMTWLGKIVPPAALVYVTVWSWLSGFISQVPSIPVLTMLDDVVVMYLGFKVATRELRRYQEYLRRRWGTNA